MNTTRHSKNMYNIIKYNAQTNLYIREPLVSSNNESEAFGSLPRCKKADLMTADRAEANRAGPRRCCHMREADQQYADSKQIRCKA